MRRFQGHILALSCATLLLLQMVGLHLHASADAGANALHAEHVHGAVDPDGYDHTTDRDVSVVEYGAFWAKLAPLVLGALLLPAGCLLVRWIGPANPILNRLPESVSGWRPPLRAPPDQLLTVRLD